jgi:hypothetical protein
VHDGRLAAVPDGAPAEVLSPDSPGALADSLREVPA